MKAKVFSVAIHPIPMHEAGKLVARVFRTTIVLEETGESFGVDDHYPVDRHTPPEMMLVDRAMLAEGIELTSRALGHAIGEATPSGTTISLNDEAVKELRAAKVKLDQSIRAAVAA